MIWSVSTFVRRSATARPVWVVERCPWRQPSRRRSRSAGLRRACPTTAVAAATCGDTRWVRPPLPCRPSKLRLDVEALRSPGRELVGVHARGTSSSRRAATRRRRP